MNGKKVSELDREDIKMYLKTRKKNEKEMLIKENLQKVYSTIIKDKLKTEQSLSSICRGILKQEPLFHEQEKEVQNKEEKKEDSKQGKFSLAGIKKSVNKFLSKHKEDENIINL